MPRTLTEIADEASELLDKANTAFVPANLTRGFELNVEFMQAVAALAEPGQVVDRLPALPTR